MRIPTFDIRNQRAVRLAACDAVPLVRRWRPGDATAYILELLQKKDAKALEKVREELKQARFGPMRQLTAAYLVFSYNAHVKDYLVLPLEFIV